MKILSITAGAAGMYCGSCLRDNALAAELIGRGHDVVLLPLYTPTLTDEPNVSQSKVFFGGISVYLQQHLSIFRNTPWLLDRMWDSTPALKAASRRSIPTNPRLLGELTLSVLKGEDGFQRKEIGKLVHWLKQEKPPDIVNLPNALLIGLAQPIKQALGTPVLCTLQGEDLFLEGLERDYRASALDLIRKQIDQVDLFVSVSEYYADFMSQYLEIPSNKIEVVPLGINLEGYSPRDREAPRSPFTVGYFARVYPEKGLHLLCEAYRRLHQRSGFPKSRLEVAGYLGPEHMKYLDQIRHQMADWGLSEEFQYRGVLDRQQKIEFLQNLDVFSVPSPYREPKGLYLLEAMASGVPVVQPRHGAFLEIIARTKGGLLFESDDPDSLAEGILSIAGNPELAHQLSRNGSAGVRDHYSVSRMADRTLEVYEAVLERPKASQGKSVPSQSI
jgi:glycosyltransferase involved in cell wall biosynthesis